MKRPYECKFPDCDKKFTTRFSLRRHMTTHQTAKQFVCVICFKRFALGQYLKEHTYIHTGQKPFKCPYEGCTKAFRQAGKLSMHKKLHQNKIFIVQKIKKRPQAKKMSDSTHDSCCSETKIEISLKKLRSHDSSIGTIETQEDLFQNELASPVNESCFNLFPTSFSQAVNGQEAQNIQILNQFTDSLRLPEMVFTRCLPLPSLQQSQQINRPQFAQVGFY